MSTISTLISTTRPPFLLLTPVVLSLVYALSYWLQGDIDLGLASLIMIAALSAHISVNTFNEYADFSSELDFNTRRTPFSGGSGALPSDPNSAIGVYLLAWSTLIITIGIGLYFIYLRGWMLLPLGLVGIGIITSYTSWLTKKPWLCLIAPGFAFGPIFIIGSCLVLTGNYSLNSIAVSLPIFFLSNNLLLLNQFPDIQADRDVGRNHLAIQHGTSFASRIFLLFTLLAYISLGIAVSLSLLPQGALLGLLPGVFSLIASIKIIISHQNAEALLAAMKLNVITNLSTPILIAIGILL